METLFGKVVEDLARLAAQKWYVGMGFAGLFVVVWVLLKGTPHDDVLVAAVGTAMMGFGFAEAETRTFRTTLIPHMRAKITGPARRITVAGVALYALGSAGALTAVLRAAGLI